MKALKTGLGKWNSKESLALLLLTFLATSASAGAPRWDSHTFRALGEHFGLKSVKHRALLGKVRAPAPVEAEVIKEHFDKALKEGAAPTDEEFWAEVKGTLIAKRNAFLADLQPVIEKLFVPAMDGTERMVLDGRGARAVLAKTLGEGDPELAVAIERGRIFWTELAFANGEKRMVLILPRRVVAPLGGPTNVLMVMETADSFQVITGEIPTQNLLKLDSID